MGVDPLDFCRNRLPAIFDETVARLREQAQQGDAGLRAAFEAGSEVPVTSRVRLTGAGGGELLLVLAGETLSVREPAEGAPGDFGYALSVPTAVAAHVLSRTQAGGEEAERLARALSVLASRAAVSAFGERPFELEASVRRVPVLGDVRVQASLGRPALSAPQFMLAVEYDELADAIEQGVSPHELFFAGKLEMDGDVSRAMLLGMTLAQLAGGR
ncbi:MAG: SCP2 sterol-binding domain-containing protein [Myxococcales bacterium]|jgi:hypothetical protein